MQLDLRLLEIFCAVYEARSFSKAAKTLRVSQPTVSEHIKNLEEALDVQLFDRLPRATLPEEVDALLPQNIGPDALNDR